MSEWTAERLAQRAFDLGLIDGYQFESVWGELGSRSVPVDDVVSLMLRRELITNWQLDRLQKGNREGYFYGKYKILYSVGAGTFARVYRATSKDETSDKIVAVKVLRQRYSDDIETTEQFMREARTVIPLRHPNIVPIYEVDKMRGRPYMVMDFVEGRNLRDFARIQGALEPLDSLKIIIDIVSGLEYAARKGITHRDLKLSNVLLASSGRAQLVDFGLAGVADESTAGNPRSIDYAGLERATSVRKNDPRSDIFFAGCMLYHLLAGQPALSETRERIQRLAVGRYKEIKPITVHQPSLPAPVVVVVNKAIEFDPSRRYATAAEFLRELKAVHDRVKKGDLTPVDAAQLAADLEKNKPVEQEGANRTLMVVESRMELQDALRDKLKKRGYRVLVIRDPQRAFDRLTDDMTEEKVADGVIIGATELEDKAFDFFNKLGEHELTRDLPVVLIHEKAQAGMLKDAKLTSQRVLMPMPLKMLQLRKTLLKLLANAAVADEA